MPVLVAGRLSRFASLRFVLAAIALLSGGASLAVFGARERIVEARDLEIRTYTIILAINDVREAIRATVTAHNGFLTRAETDGQVRLDEALRQIGPTVDRLRMLVGDNPQQLANLSRLADRTDVLLHALVNGMRSGYPGSLPTPAGIAHVVEARRLREETLDVLGAMQREEGEVLLERRTDADAAEEWLWLLPGAAAGVSVIALLVLLAL